MLLIYLELRIMDLDPLGGTTVHLSSKFAKRKMRVIHLAKSLRLCCCTDSLQHEKNNSSQISAILLVVCEIGPVIALACLSLGKIAQTVRDHHTGLQLESSDLMEPLHLFGL